jgi:hypothetical protein
VFGLLMLIERKANRAIHDHTIASWRVYAGTPLVDAVLHDVLDKLRENEELSPFLRAGWWAVKAQRTRPGADRWELPDADEVAKILKDLQGSPVAPGDLIALCGALHRSLG